MVCGGIIIFFCRIYARSGSRRTLCLFLGRASGFGTAGVEVGWFRVGTADEEDRLGSHGVLSVDSQEWQVCLHDLHLGFNTCGWVGHREISSRQTMRMACAAWVQKYEDGGYGCDGAVVAA